MSAATSSDAQSDPGAADAYSAIAETEQLVWNDSFRNSATSPFQTQNGAATEAMPTTAIAAAAISGAPCTSLTTSPLAVRGAVSTALDGIWIEVFTIFLSTEIKPETPATRMQPLVGSD